MISLGFLSILLEISYQIDYYYVIFIYDLKLFLFYTRYNNKQLCKQKSELSIGTKINYFYYVQF